MGAIEFSERVNTQNFINVIIIIYETGFDTWLVR